ncbi:shikimate dehydrogenase [Rhizohabitans arisaemae]|uniref:shikimate dehydrogenase n=1 Tax=Rhizohabitans arisaemae TaxID=2720610 RepID=UPI0024B0E1F9|nr:shikimate dehydrogenase [Rhizohabitans arisaemae]
MPQLTLCAVLGSPIAHSLSPALHRGAYAAMGLDDWRYAAIECDEAGLPALIDGLDDRWAGLSLTMPLKRAVLPLLDEVSPLAVAVGGANTVLLGGGVRRGDNTDVYGIVRALEEAGAGKPGSAIVLGGGATACSALAALQQLGLSEATLLVREVTRAGEALAAAERLGVAAAVQPLAQASFEADLVISTLPSGGADAYAERIAASAPTVFDVAYAPWPSPLAEAVRRAGGTVVGGFEMLLHQAARQVELITGRHDVPVEAMRAAGLKELAARS